VLETRLCRSREVNERFHFTAKKWPRPMGNFATLQAVKRKGAPTQHRLVRVATCVRVIDAMRGHP
jgi:hypothetical protein